MVGRSQASNLSGMLSQLSDTIGEMGGPGEKYLDTFRRLQAPDPDMSSAASLQEYAEWARRNGYDEEADRYMALAYQQKQKEIELAKQASQANMLADVAEKAGGSKKLAGAGDTRALDLTKESLLQDLARARESGDPEQVKAVAQQIAAIDDLMPSAASIKAKKGAAAIDQYKKMLESGNLDETQQANLRTALVRLENDPEVQAAYREMERNKLALAKDQLAVDAAEYAAERRPFEEEVEEVQLLKLQWDVASKQALAQEREDMRIGATVAAQNIGRNQWELTDEQKATMSGAAQAEARKLMGDESKRRSDMDKARSGGTVGDSTLAAAKKLAETNQGINTLLNDYLKSKESAMSVADQVRTATQLTSAVHQIQLASANNMQLEAVVGSHMEAMFRLGSHSGLFDGQDYVDVMQSGDQFTISDSFLTMRKDITNLAVSQGLGPKDLTPEKVYELMDAAAQQSSDPAWVAANDKLSKRRRAVERQMNKVFVDDRNEWVEEVIATNKDSSWNEAQIHKYAENYHNWATGEIQKIVAMPAELQYQELRRQMNTNGTSIFRPREFGPADNPMTMPPVLKQEDYEYLIGLTEGGVKITYQHFIPNEDKDKK